MTPPVAWEPVIWMGPLGDGVRRRGVPAAAVLEECDRCDFAGPHKEEPRHEGRSTRRDCGRCGRTLGFPRWYEEPSAERKQTTKARRASRRTKKTAQS